MKPNPAETKVRQRMEAGVLSRDGFLGDDSRPLADIVADDEAVLAAAGVTAQRVGEVLQEIFAAAEAGLETQVTLFGGAVKARVIEGMGRTPCPFACGVRNRKGELTIEFGPHRLVLTPLSVHMVREHGFFQGRGSRYRLEPALAVELLHACQPPREACAST
ncbi:MAG: hypothetical protein A3K19_31795 [Lentisphaerae bacterium RIFOXYB12_FULL_65_16]|nr:MAG: hypothetical protein A3K18_10575 [Lentisphaerae bacterium RIFOXYA12_64_32]OGV88686.1 MAG: hypothetical protein A3K19_31795 [Lentisphaerae bacterium RIFOXYB12_FULL_65_16]